MDDIRNNVSDDNYTDEEFNVLFKTSSPTLSTISTKSRSARDTRTDAKRTPDASKRRKSISKPTVHITFRLTDHNIFIFLRINGIELNLAVNIFSYSLYTYKCTER